MHRLHEILSCSHYPNSQASWSSFIFRPSTSCLFNYHSMGQLPLVASWAQVLEGGHCHILCTILAAPLIHLSNVQLSQSGTGPPNSTWTSKHVSQLAMKPRALTIHPLFHCSPFPFLSIYSYHSVSLYLILFSLFNTCVFSN